MNIDQQVKAKYDYWFEKKPNTETKQEKYLFTVKPESLSDVISRLQQLAKSKVSSILGEYYGNKAARFEESPLDSSLIKKAYSTIAGDIKKHHNEFLIEVMDEKKDFSSLVTKIKVYPPQNSRPEFTIELPCPLEELNPPPAHQLEKIIALTGLGDLKEFMKKETIDLSEMQVAGYNPHIHNDMEIKLVDEAELKKLVSKAVAESYEVLFEHYKGKEVSVQIDKKAELLRRLRQLVIDFEMNDAIPEESDPVRDDINTEFSKVPAGRLLERAKKREIAESFRTSWTDDPEQREELVRKALEELKRTVETKEVKSQDTTDGNTSETQTPSS